MLKLLLKYRKAVKLMKENFLWEYFNNSKNGSQKGKKILFRQVGPIIQI